MTRPSATKAVGYTKGDFAATSVVCLDFFKVCTLTIVLWKGSVSPSVPAARSVVIRGVLADTRCSSGVFGVSTDCAISVKERVASFSIGTRTDCPGGAFGRLGTGGRILVFLAGAAFLRGAGCGILRFLENFFAPLSAH